MDPAVIIVSVLGSGGLATLITHAIDQRGYRGRARFDQTTALHKTVNAIHGHAIELYQHSGEGGPQWLTSPDGTTEGDLGALAETPEGEEIATYYVGMLDGFSNMNFLVLSVNHEKLKDAIKRWRSKHRRP